MDNEHLTAAVGSWICTKRLQPLLPTFCPSRIKIRTLHVFPGEGRISKVMSEKGNAERIICPFQIHAA